MSDARRFRRSAHCAIRKLCIRCTGRLIDRDLLERKFEPIVRMDVAHRLGDEALLFAD